MTPTIERVSKLHTKMWALYDEVCHKIKNDSDALYGWGSIAVK